MRIGAHTSIGGGLQASIRRAEQLGCDCLQIFARNPRGWAARPLDKAELREFRDARERAELWPLAIHSAYLINLACREPALLQKSREAFRDEIGRALELGADYLVVHPGSATGAPPEEGIANAVESIRDASRGFRLLGASGRRLSGQARGLTILIENTAGQGSCIGCTFEQVNEIIDSIDDVPVGVCLDTAHTFASGYDISTREGLEQALLSIESTFGFDQIKLVHCNDSKAALNSRVDRHQHIGLGELGDDAFRRITHNLKFRSVPLILETPVDKQRGYDWNIRRLRELSGEIRTDEGN